MARAGAECLGRDHKGPEAVLAFLAQLKRRSNGPFRIEILDMLSKPERVLVFQRETATMDGKNLDEIAVVDFEIHKQKSTEATVYHGDCYRCDSFWKVS